MSEDEIKQIIINGHLIGIVGLDDAIKKKVKTLPAKNDEEINNNLFKKIVVNNYVPPSVRNDYGNALLREFKIAQGIPVALEPVQGLNIEVLGIGCTRCDQLENDVRDLLSEMKIAANLRHITDPKEIAHYRLLESPALVINNQVLSVGEVPPKSNIRQWIIEAYNSINK
ncbi:MAG: thioredoxin family protein [Smithella sp.]